MVQPKIYNAPPEGASGRRIPGMKAELRRVYDGLVALGATSPTSGRPVEYLAKQMHEPKNRMLHELHELEGKGVVGHQTSGHDTTWYCRR
jgi:hypothetical protein